jgi:hypothetical protein
VNHITGLFEGGSTVYVVNFEQIVEEYAIKQAERAYDWAVFQGRLGEADQEAERAYQEARAQYLADERIEALLREAGDL